VTEVGEQSFNAILKSPSKDSSLAAAIKHIFRLLRGDLQRVKAF
jgi:hypothetical protein